MEKKKLLRRVVTNKYLITILVFSVWMVFGDSNRIIDRVTEHNKLKQLEKDKAYFLKKVEEDSKRMLELRTDKRNLEKFAREQYLMKRPNEDIFIIIDKD